MKNFNFLSSVSALCIFATGCNEWHESAGRSGNIEIDTPRVAVHGTRVSEDSECTFRYISNQCMDIDVSISSTISPMSVGSGTRAAVITTSTLEAFSMDGYLGDEILSCSGASATDKNNRHFMVDAAASRNAGGDWSFINEQKWRSCVTHYFWAHTENLPDFAVSGSKFGKADFSYTNSGEGDLLIANHEQYYDDEYSPDKNNGYITGLTFKHALSEIVINTGDIIMKQINVKKEIETPIEARCTIKKQGLISYTAGKCTIDNESSWNLQWSDLNTPTMMEIIDGNVFVIPQATPNLTSLLYIHDNKKLITLPVFFELNKGNAPDNLESGSKYTYNLKGSIIAPYWEGEGINAEFTGKDFCSFAILEDLASKYVKKIKITWTGMSESNSAGTYVWLGCQIGNTVPSVEDYPITKEGLANKPLIGFGAAYTGGGGIPTILKGKVEQTAALAKDYKLSAEFDLTNVSDSENVSFYLVYDGGNNSGKANWSVRDLTIEVTEFKLPY